MCRAWLWIHSPQYNSLRSAAIRSPTTTPAASSTAAQALIW